MPVTRISLEQVRIASPCPKSWDEMSGDNRARFCSHCNKHVHNLSALREDEAQRLICDSADEAGLPADPEFRSAFLAYVEWGTRIALANSQPGAEPPPAAPVPRWGWGEAPPYPG